MRVNDDSNGGRKRESWDKRCEVTDLSLFLLLVASRGQSIGSFHELDKKT